MTNTLDKRPRVFGIGWQKTGTKSLRCALTRLGYKVHPWKLGLVARWHEGNIAPILRSAADGEAFDDFPWPLVFRELDRAFPDARFILTTRRDDATWLASAQKHMARRRWVGHYLIYGSYDAYADPEVFLRRYREHNAAVRAYFADRPGKLLDICFERGEQWTPLCAFLGVAGVPSEPFPHQNTAAAPW